ncbi:hypothetical protein LXL04_013386 [Taraxacum kok-saghyz]
MLTNLKSFSKVEFISMLSSYLEKNREKVGIPLAIGPKDEGYTKVLIKTLGFLMGEAVLGLVLEACFAFEIWEILEILIIGGLIDGPSSKNLLQNLIEKKRSDLVCLCITHVSDLQFSDIYTVLNLFLSPPKEAYPTMIVIRKEWETRALSATEMAKDKKNLASNSAAILLMMAHDEFTTSELCLHYLISSSNLDDVIFSACVGSLNGSQIMGFVRYLKKWLKKYEKFPSSSSLLGLDSVPSLENVTKCLLLRVCS